MLQSQLSVAMESEEQVTAIHFADQDKKDKVEGEGFNVWQKRSI